MTIELELLRKIDEWQNKAYFESDPFNKYVSVFIAYNMFYNLYEKRKTGKFRADFTYGDNKRAIATISLVKTDQLFQLLEPDLEKYVNIIPVFREEYWPTSDSKRKLPISQTLKESFHSRNAVRTIDMLIKWLYKVRCNLVHGEKSYNDDDQKRLLEMSSLLLDKILTHLESRYRDLYRVDIEIL